ncbi:hypothetical protein ACI784_11085 [Geodermatophilus sp. SYSU D01186]
MADAEALRSMLRGQFTYTASQRPGPWDDHPGWKVQSVLAVPGRAPLSEEVVRQAAGFTGGFIPPVVPELASRADVDALPRRLRLDVVDDRLVCLSHVVAAGPDYSGRANFFAHGLLVEPGDDEDDDDGSYLRPADLWHADHWLRPLGPVEAETAQPDPALTRLPRGALDDAALEEFMRRHPNQRDMVLAAVERRLVGGGGPVVVVGDDPESVVQWMRLVGSLVLPATAWQLPFSSYERARDLDARSAQPFAIVGVPAADGAAAAALPGSHFAVLQDGEPPLRGGVDHWTLPDGRELVAGPWARLAESVVLTGLTPAVAEIVDALADEVGASATDEPLWALGAAVLLLDDLPWDELAEDAAELVLACWPRALDAEVSTINLLLDRLHEHADWDTIANAISRRAPDASESLVEQLVRVDPLREALAGPAEYRRTGRSVPTSLPGLLPGMQNELETILRNALDWVDGAGAIAPRALLHIASLLATTSPLQRRVTELARTLVVPRLLDESVDPRVLGWPSMPEWLWLQLRPVLTSELEQGQHEPGRAFSRATHEWLGDLGRLPGELRFQSLRLTEPVEWERAAYTVFRARRSVSRARGEASELERGAAFLSAVHNDDLPFPDGRCARAALDTYPRELLDLRQALILMRSVPADLPFADVLLDVLDRTPPSHESRQGIKELRARERLLPSQEKRVSRHLAKPSV